MKKSLTLAFFWASFFSLSLEAKPLPPEIVHPIHIMDLIIRGNQYGDHQCGDYLCKTVSADNGTYLELTRTNLRESRKSDVDFRLKIILKGEMVNADVTLEYLQDAKSIRFDSKSDGLYLPTKGSDPLVFKVLVGWLDWMLEER